MSSKLNELIDEVTMLLKQLKEDDGHSVSRKRIEKWINQFDEADREFLLSELIPILRQRYIPKSGIVKFLTELVDEIAKSKGYETVPEFLDRAVFLDMQEEGKSQKVMLELLAGILREKYEYDIEHCGLIEHKHFIYLDDILCTGNTLFYDIKEWANQENNKEQVENKKVDLCCCFVFMHKANLDSVDFRFGKEISAKFSSKLTYWRESEIDNTRTPAGYANLKHVENNLTEDVIEYKNRIIAQVNEHAEQRKFKARGEDFFRAANRPLKEDLFSSAESRQRFESILLRKGIEILKNANVQKLNVRALGFDLPSHKTFGFGSLCFTWRNIPNNAPLVFWYSGGDFFPLFEKHRAIPTFDF